MYSRTLLGLILVSTITGCTLNIQAPTPSPSEAAPGTTPAAAPLANAPAAPSGAATATTPAAAPVKAPTPTGDGPTEEEVKHLVKSMFTATYQETWMKDDEFSIEFTDYQAGPKTQKNLFGGYFDQPIDVWPIRMNVNIKWQKGDDVRSWKRGTQINESFSFYRDEFGGWNYRTSGL